MPSIALVDDDRNILLSTSLAFEAEGYKVLSYSDGGSALAAIEANPPDLVILDVKMPRIDGIELLRRIRRSSDVPVILLTSKLDVIDEVVGFTVGADDFIRKPCSQRVLAERVMAILRRTSLKRESGHVGAGSARSIVERGALTLDVERHECIWKGAAIRLTVTEFAIVKALANRPGIVKDRNALMDVAYDNDVYVDDRTIDSHVKRVRKKFRAVDPDFDMIKTLYGIGYKFKDIEVRKLPSAACRHS